MKHRFVFAASILAAAVFAISAAAHTATFNTSATLRLQAGPSDSFRGAVSSPQAACRRDGWSSFYNVNPGYTGTTVYRRRTNVNGSWAVDFPGHATPGNWYAIVTVKRATPTGHNHLCRGARTRTIEINAPGGGHDG